MKLYLGAIKLLQIVHFFLVQMLSRVSMHCFIAKHICYFVNELETYTT